MDKKRKSIREVLRDAARELAPKHEKGERAGEPNVTAFARDTKIGQGNAQRILAGDTSVGIDLVEQLAWHYRLEPWQLLVPGFRKEKPPRLEVQPRNERVARLFEAVNNCPPEQLSAVEAMLRAFGSWRSPDDQQLEERRRQAG